MLDESKMNERKKQFPSNEIWFKWNESVDVNWRRCFCWHIIVCYNGGSLLPLRLIHLNKVFHWFQEKRRRRKANARESKQSSARMVRDLSWWLKGEQDDDVKLSFKWQIFWQFREFFLSYFSTKSTERTKSTNRAQLFI